MTTYAIRVHLSKATAKRFILFAANPVPTGGPRVYYSVLQSVIIPAQHDRTFTFTRDLYGICGIKELAVGNTIANFDSTEQPLTIGQRSGSPTVLGTTTEMYVRDGLAMFNGRKATPGAGPGTFQIKTTTFTEKNVFIGLGNKSEGRVHPMATFQADPNHIYTMKPNLKYYIAAGNYNPGVILGSSVASNLDDVIGIPAIGVPQMFDFSKGVTLAETVYNADGTYSSPVYK